MADILRWKVYDSTGNYIAACKYTEDAAMLVAGHGYGMQIRDGHSTVVWREGEEDFTAAGSYDHVALAIQKGTRR